MDQKNAASPEAKSIFAQAEILVLKDESHLQAEERWHACGRSNRDRLLSVTFTVRKNLLRMISARSRKKRERKHYALD